MLSNLIRLILNKRIKNMYIKSLPSKMESIVCRYNVFRILTKNNSSGLSGR